MEKLITILFRVPELQRKILITAGFLALFRIGSFIPLPIVNQEQLARNVEQMSQSAAGRVMATVALFGGTQIGMSTIFGLGIMPYISASIIFQLLGSIVPSLEALMKEGESGRRKINEYTRYAAVVLCLIQSAFWVRYMMYTMNIVPPDNMNVWDGLVSVMIMTAGTIFLMWIGEQIDEYGIGNGISLIIMAGILSRMPSSVFKLLSNSSFQLTPPQGTYGILVPITLVALFIGVVIGVIAITESQRRIPTQSAKHVRGRRVYGGSKQYLPLKVNQSGVMPIIFASSLLMFPLLILSGMSQAVAGWAGSDSAFKSSVYGILELVKSDFQRHGYLYTMAYVILIYFFCYFWTAIMFNPKDVAENLKDYGSFIPGYRPGARTANYLEKVMLRITYVGAAFLSVVAVIPAMIQAGLNVDYDIASFLGGTGLLIVISVCIDLIQKIDSYLIMSNYSGLMGRK
ncbi:MAG: preprotein translocase subunit SecY [bacterium]